MNRMLPCPHCASDNLEVVVVLQESRVLAVRCRECGARGPESLGNETDAMFAWNQRMGRLTVVK